MAQIVVKCPSCKKGLKVNMVGEDQPVTCPACKYQSKLSEFPVVKLKQVYCPSCKTPLTINAEYVGVTGCPKCKYRGDIQTFPGSIPTDTDDTVVKTKKSGPDDKLYKPGVLVLVEGSCNPSKISLQKGLNSIGRKSASSRSSIQLETSDDYMSKNHVNIDLIMKPDATFEHRLSDNKSTNGTYHNKEKIDVGDVIILRPDDLIHIGRTTFKFMVE